MKKEEGKFNAVVIYGINHKGSTYNIVQEFLKKFNNIHITEFFLSSDNMEFCKGCYSCFFKGEEKCPHYEGLKPIIDSMLEAKLIILASPCYVCDVSGQMKAFLDHLGYMWMPHRPEERMFNKIGVVISTAAGAGVKHTNKTMKKALTYMGVGKVYSYGAIVAANSWKDVKEKKKNKIEKHMTSLRDKIERLMEKGDKLSPSLFVKLIFMLMRAAHKKNHGILRIRSIGRRRGGLIVQDHGKRISKGSYFILPLNFTVISALS